MRIAVVLAAATVVAGFTKADAEKALDGKWAARLNDVSVVINRTMNVGMVYSGGQLTEGPLAISEPVARAVGVQIGPSKYVVHVHERGDTIGFAKVGERSSLTLYRVPE